MSVVPLKKFQDLSIALVGYQDEAERELLKQISEKKFPISNCRLFTPDPEPEESLEFDSGPLITETLTAKSFEGIDLAFFFLPNEEAASWIPKAGESGTICIDSGNLFASDSEVPSVVPEINFDDLHDYLNKGVIHSPSQSIVPMLLACHPLQENFGLKSLRASIYYPASFYGKEGIKELSSQTIALCNGIKDLQPNLFPHPTAFNMIPQVGTFESDTLSSEEEQAVSLIKSYFGNKDLPCDVSAIQVPVFSGVSYELRLQFEKNTKVSEIKQCLEAASGIRVWDNPKEGQYPLSFFTTDRDDVFVGRIREDLSSENGFYLWIACDNLLRGSALNLLSIAEGLIRLEKQNAQED